MSTAGHAAARAEDVARASYGKLVAILAKRSGDIAAAEDALSLAFEAALKTWPVRGVPDRPEAWLLTTARNRQTDSTRRAQRMVVTDEVPEMAIPESQEDLPDERLKLMFVCAHPAIDAGVHTPLMLQTVLGVEAQDIARAFLIPPTAMAQRLVRAKAKIKAAGIPFAVPEPDVLPTRLGAVLEAVYGAYALDWMGEKDALSHEALFLASILAELMPEDPEALGLLSLLAFLHARKDARVDDGVLVPLHEQDVTRWDQALTHQAGVILARAAACGRQGRFQIEAAIQAVHAARMVTGRTDWRALQQLYAGLMETHPTIGAAVARAAAAGEDAGASEGLALLDRIDPKAISGFQPAWAARAHLLARSGDREAAAAAYDKAISLATDGLTRRWLERRRTSL